MIRTGEYKNYGQLEGQASGMANIQDFVFQTQSSYRIWASSFKSLSSFLLDEIEKATDRI